MQTRRVLPIRIWYGSTDHHPEPQWFLHAFDIERGAVRDFAMRHVGEWQPIIE